MAKKKSNGRKHTNKKQRRYTLQDVYNIASIIFVAVELFFLFWDRLTH